jgi:hypothetical protein
LVDDFLGLFLDGKRKFVIVRGTLTHPAKGLRPSAHPFFKGMNPGK